MKTWFHRLFLSLVLVCVASQVNANTCAVIAGGGNWSASGTWTACGSVAPTATDDVILTGLTGTLTIDGTSGSPNLARSLDATGVTVGTMAQASAKQLNIGDPAGGATGVFKLVAGLTYAPNSGSVLKFVSTTGVNNITTAGKTMGQLVFDGVGGSWQFQDALTGNQLQSGLTLTNGSLDAASHNWTNVLLSSNNSNTRSLTMGTMTDSPGNTGQTLLWDITNSTGMTLSAANMTVSLTQANAANTFAGGGLTYGALSMTTATTEQLTITGANTFTNLTLSTAGAGDINSGYILAANQTVSGTFTANGNSAVNRVYIKSSVPGTRRTITVNTTVTVSKADFQDIVGAGSASWNIAAVTGGSGDCGNNSGITFTTPISAFFKTAVSANWTAGPWETTTGGSTPITNTIPLCQDTAKFDANSVTTSGKTITIDAAALRLPAMDWTGVANTPAFAFTNATSLFGSVTFVSSMTVSGTSNATLEGRGPQTITTAGKTWTAPIILNSQAGIWTQGDNFASSSTFIGTTGTWAGASTFTTGFTAFSDNGATVTLTGNLNLTGSFGVTASSSVTGANTVITGGTSFQNSASTVNVKGFSGTSFNVSTGTTTIGSSGLTLSTTFTLNNTATVTINGTSTVTGSITLSGAGTFNLNANLTGSSTFATTGQTLTIAAGKTLAFSGGSIVGGAGGGGSFTYGN